MRKWIFALALALLVSACAVAADVDIAVKNRIANVEDGYCVWCSLETLGRHHNIKSLRGLVKNKVKTAGYYRISYVQNGPYFVERREWVKDGGATQEQAIEELKRLGVSYRIQWKGSHRTKILYDACKEKLGAVIGFKPPKDSNVGHAVVLVGINDKEVEYIDSNDHKKVSVMSRKEFDKKWSGGAIVIDMMPDED